LQSLKDTWRRPGTKPSGILIKFGLRSYSNDD
jgi:hypothetical protein